MASFLVSVLYLVIMFAVIVGAFMLLKKFVFSRVPINKFIPLGIAIILFLIQIFLKPDNMLITAGLTFCTVIFFLWFWDIQQTGGPRINKDKKIVMKPKAKPNRVKNKEDN